MSLETALARAEFRHLQRMIGIAHCHHQRSGRQSYLDYAEALTDRYDDLYARCKFTGLAYV